MLSALDCQKNRLKYMLHERIVEDVDDYPGNINRILREEADGVDIKWAYGEVFEKAYRMMLEIYSAINNSTDPYSDPAVHAILEKYNYYISPSGRHIYGAGPTFNWLKQNPTSTLKLVPGSFFIIF